MPNYQLDFTAKYHFAAAEARGIANGDWVSIETAEGVVRVRARLNDDLDPRVVVGEHGWWRACPEIGAPGYDPFGLMGANFNLLIGSAALDPVSGTASHRSLSVRDPAGGLNAHPIHRLARGRHITHMTYLALKILY